MPRVACGVVAAHVRIPAQLIRQQETLDDAPLQSLRVQVSWMVQLQATGVLATLGGGGVRMVGGVYTSGGSYACYPLNSSTGKGVCAQ